MGKSTWHDPNIRLIQYSRLVRRTHFHAGRPNLAPMLAKTRTHSPHGNFPWSFAIFSVTWLNAALWLVHSKNTALWLARGQTNPLYYSTTLAFGRFLSPPLLSWEKNLIQNCHVMPVQPLLLQREYFDFVCLRFHQLYYSLYAFS